MSQFNTATLSELIKASEADDLPDMRFVRSPVITEDNVRQDPQSTEAVLAVGSDLYGTAFLRGFDWYYRQKLKNSGLYRALNIATGRKRQTRSLPYRDEILAVAAATKTPGALALNFSYDVACSTGIYLDKDGHPTLIRMLDWALRMAPMTTVLTRRGNHGNWLDITYPGLVGSLTSMGENFAAAINRAPVPQHRDAIQDHSLPGYLPPARDNRRSIIQAALSNDISPIHLMRQVFEECASFDEAVHKIVTTKTNCPVIMPIVGKTSEEAAIIYKDRDYCAVATLPQAVDRLGELFQARSDVRVFEENDLAAANHWPGGYGLDPAHPRRDNSDKRRSCLKTILRTATEQDVFDQLRVAETDTTGQHIVSNTALVARLCPAKREGIAIAMENQKLALKPLQLTL